MGTDCTQHLHDANEHVNAAISRLDLLDFNALTPNFTAIMAGVNIAILKVVYERLIEEVELATNDIAKVEAAMTALKGCARDNAGCRSLAEVISKVLAEHCLKAFRHVNGVLTTQNDHLGLALLSGPLFFHIGTIVAADAKAKARAHAQNIQNLLELAAPHCGQEVDQLEQGLVEDASPESAWVALSPRAGTSSFTEIDESTVVSTKESHMAVTGKMPKGWPPLMIPAKCTVYAVDSWRVSARAELGGVSATMLPLLFRWSLNGNPPNKLESNDRVAYFETAAGSDVTLRVEVETTTGFIMAAEKTLAVPRQQERCAVADQRGLNKFMIDVASKFGEG